MIIVTGLILKLIKKFLIKKEMQYFNYRHPSIDDECEFDQVEIYSIMFFEDEIWIGTVDGYLMLYCIINYEINCDDKNELLNYDNKKFLLSNNNLINNNQIFQSNNKNLIYEKCISPQSRFK